jgi:hypothetical protein
MAFPTQVTFHGMQRDASLEGKIRDRIQRLVRLSAEISACRVVVESPDEVHLVLRLPRTVLSVTKSSNHFDLDVAVRLAFEAAERALTEFTRHPRAA